jgi:hypothetical protein
MDVSTMSCRVSLFVSSLALALATGTVACDGSVEPTDAAEAALTEPDPPKEPIPSSVVRLPIVGAPAGCPDAWVESTGGSYMDGIENSVDVTELSGNGRMALRRSETEESIELVYSTRLAEAHATCVGRTEERFLFNEASHFHVRVTTSTVWVEVTISKASLVLEKSEPRRGKAFFQIAEAG